MTGPTDPDPDPDSEPRAPARPWLKWGAIVLAIGGLVAAMRLLPLNAWIERFLASVAAAGIWGPVIFAAVYALATVFAVPASLLTLGAGFVFGVVKGSIVVSIASTLGACVAFLIGRRVAGAAVARRIDGNERFAAIARAVEENGFKIVLLTRLSPLFPFVFLNYAFGLTKVRFRDYALASWIGMMPGTVMYVYFGSAVTNLTALFSGEVEGGVGQQALFWGGLVATIAVTVVVTRVARRALREAAAETEPADEAPAPDAH